DRAPDSGSLLLWVPFGTPRVPLSALTSRRRSIIMLRPRLRFGIFMAPFHPVKENPTLCLERDRELIEWLDQIGFDEAWIGEHHSAGYEIIASPELFIADVAA